MLFPANPCQFGSGTWRRSIKNGAELSSFWHIDRAEWREGLEVVFSRQGETADAVVKRLAEKYGSDCAVVSSDREITDFARVQGCTVITSGDFETRLQVSGARPFARKQEADEEEPVRRDPKKKGNPKKLPKALRQKARQLKRF